MCELTAQDWKKVCWKPVIPQVMSSSIELFQVELKCCVEREDKGRDGSEWFKWRCAADKALLERVFP